MDYFNQNGGKKKKTKTESNSLKSKKSGGNFGKKIINSVQKGGFSKSDFVGGNFYQLNYNKKISIFYYLTDEGFGKTDTFIFANKRTRKGLENDGGLNAYIYLYNLYGTSGGYLEAVKLASITDLLMLTEFDFQKLVLTGSDDRKYNFQGANLKGAYFANAKLNYVHFDNAELENANFNEAELYDIIFSKANLKNANFENAKLDIVDFSDANLKGAVLTGAKLEKTVLTGAKLEGAIIDGAIFTNAIINEKLRKAINNKKPLINDFIRIPETNNIYRRNKIAIPNNSSPNANDYRKTLEKLANELHKRKILPLDNTQIIDKSVINLLKTNYINTANSHSHIKNAIKEVRIFLLRIQFQELEQKIMSNNF